MHAYQVLQGKDTWRFDITSAVIGAAIAWLMAAFLYSKRQEIKKFVDSIWAPIKDWRRKTRAGQGEKYLTALQEAVKSELLFHPEHPESLFIPPVLLAPPNLPKTLAEAAETPLYKKVPYQNILCGASNIVMTGSLGSGRTTALLMAIWEATKHAEEGQPFRRIPVWIDLAKINDLAEEEKITPLDRLLQLAALSLPQVNTKWLQQLLRKSPSLILLDNWEFLPPDNRSIVAAWIKTIAQELPESHWIITSHTQGYGQLVEIGFVPVKLSIEWSDNKFQKYIQTWADHFSIDLDSENKEILKTLKWAEKTGATTLELALRTILFVKTRQLPNRPVDTMDFLLADILPPPQLGDEMEELSDEARFTALQIITEVARINRLENRAVNRQELTDIFQRNLPPKEERHKRMENTVRKILGSTMLLHEEKKEWTLPHFVWRDFLTAYALTQEDAGSDYIQTHLEDPLWSLLVEYYIGLVEESEAFVETLLGNAAIYNDDNLILRAGRWAIVAPENCEWRSEVIKNLAKCFVRTDIDTERRYTFGKQIGMVAGETARAFFMKMLSSSELQVRAAALRGLGWSGSPREMAVLSAALNDNNFEVKKCAVLGLCDLGTTGATTLLENYLPHADEEIASIVAQSLAEMPDGPPVLQEALQHPDLLVRRAAVHGLGQIEEPWAIELIEHTMRTDPEWLVRSAAETALESKLENAEEQAVVQPQPKPEEIEWLIRWAARHGMGLGMGHAAQEMLVRAIQEGSANTKLLAILTLDQIGQKEHLSILQTLLHDSDELVKAQTREVIKHITQRYHIYTGH